MVKTHGSMSNVLEKKIADSFSNPEERIIKTVNIKMKF